MVEKPQRTSIKKMDNADFFNAMDRIEKAIDRLSVSILYGVSMTNSKIVTDNKYEENVELIKIAIDKLIKDNTYFNV